MRTETLSMPAIVPVLLDEIKDHLRIDGAEEDASLGALVASATNLIENYLDMSLIERSVAIYFDNWGVNAKRANEDTWWNGVADGSLSLLRGDKDFVSLPVKPIQSVEQVEVTAADGSSVVWGADNYYLKPGLTPTLTRKYGRAWPVPGVKTDGIKITVLAGFGPDWNHVPASIRQAVLMLATHLYYNRGNSAVNGEALKASGAKALLHAYRDMQL